MQYIETRKKELWSNFVKLRLSNGQRIVQDHMKFKRPNLINFDKLATEYEKMWVCPMFLRPGKNDFIIRSPHDPEVQAKIEDGEFLDFNDYSIEEDAAFRFYYKRRIIDVR